MHLAPDWRGGGAYWQLVRAAWEALLECELVDVTQRDLCRAAGVSQSLFRQKFWRRTDVACAVASAAYVVFAVHVSEAQTCAELIERWRSFARTLPRHYDLAFSQEHGLSPKMWNQRADLERRIGALIEREYGAALYSVVPIVAILHGSIGASPSPYMTARETLHAIEAAVRSPALARPAGH